MTEHENTEAGPARARHIYVAAAAVIVIVALIFGAGGSDAAKKTVDADSERAQENIGRMTTIGRGLTPVPDALGVPPPTDDQTPLEEPGHQPLPDGTNFELLTTERRA